MLSCFFYIVVVMETTFGQSVYGQTGLRPETHVGSRGGVTGGVRGHCPHVRPRGHMSGLEVRGHMSGLGVRGHCPHVGLRGHMSGLVVRGHM